MSLGDKPLATESLAWRVARFMVRSVRSLTFANSRWHARQIWPEATGFDHLALGLWLALLRYYDTWLQLVWGHAHTLRRFITPDRATAVPGRVMHVTGSFDVGGTQTQIAHLCTAPSARLEHRAAEVFPELNYLYRQGVKLDPSHYTGRGLIRRTLGRLVMDSGTRSFPLVQAYKLARDFRRDRPSVVVGWGHEMCVTTFVAAALARVPTIVFCIRTVNPNYGWVTATHAALLRRGHIRTQPWVAQVIVNSTLLRDDHAQWSGLPEASIDVCANGIEIRVPTAAAAAAARRSVRATYGIPEGATVIVNVGRFSDEKGQVTLVEANRLLQARGGSADIWWLLCGDGPTLPVVRALADGYGLANMVFVGRTKVVPDMLSASDIFVMPSDYEGMPNAMMEAMAAGLPCVSTTRSGARDVARDRLEALYYQPRDAVTLAQHLLFYVEHPQQARAVGAAAAARVGEFGVPRMVTTFEALLEQSMSVTPGAE